MFAKKKRWNYIFFVLFFVMILSISVMAETAYFYWYNARPIPFGGPELCKTTNAGAVTEGGSTSDSDAAPFSEYNCCKYEGTVTVYYYTDYGAYSSPANAYNVNWDADQVDCECYGKTWGLPGEYPPPRRWCCGDDTNEFAISQGVGAPACCLRQGSNICVSYSLRCRDEWDPGNPDGTETTCYDGWDNDCDGNADCKDDNCRGGAESCGVASYCDLCEDKIDNDCDNIRDCSDPDCANYVNCICPPCCAEAPDNCADGVDNDCDDEIDCIPGNADQDCIENGKCSGYSSEDTAAKCSDTLDNDLDGETDCDDVDCSEFCGGTCVRENILMDNCDDGNDNDCDGFIDHADRDCPGCDLGEKLCADGSCKETCDPEEPQGCIGDPNGGCEEGEGCACEDCFGKRDSCERELICNPTTEVCSCPSGTRMCADGKCRIKCFICGNDMLEEGEECDGGTKTCAYFDDCTPSGTAVSCTDECIWDTSVCTSCEQCDPADMDGYCCVVAGQCDRECTANVADEDTCCDSGESCTKCTPYPYDCCDDSKDGTCDIDCIAYKDPDCGMSIGSCTSNKDGCCNADSGNGCDSDCDDGIDPDCPVCTNLGATPGSPDCCSNNQDGVCDPDCIPRVDPDCTCGNGYIEPGETCDSGNLDEKTCNDFFPGYGGRLTCFGVNGEHPCHFDTSGCFNPNGECTGSEPCSFKKDCTCTECIGDQNGCNYGAVCDMTSKCACVDGTTLCKDGTCRTPENCETYDGGEQKCTGEANTICDPGEGCGCADCEGKQGPCSSSSICKEGVCYGCFLEEVYWEDAEIGEREDCVGSGNDVKMVTEGSSGCEGMTITITLYKEDVPVVLPVNQAVFKNGKAALLWTAETDEEETDYYFEADLDGEEIFESSELKVEYCIKECDEDCDHYCEQDTTYCQDAAEPGGAPGSYCEFDEGEIKIDANAMSPWCEDCDPDGLAPGQQTCAAFYDCTPGWWGSSPPGEWDGKIDSGEALKALEWGDCGEDKESNRVCGIGTLRHRLVCPPCTEPDGTPKDCCALTGDARTNCILNCRAQCCDGQETCYCEVPDPDDPIVQRLRCDQDFRPTEIKACLSEEKFPFFTNMNILIVVLILTGFYLWQTRTKPKKRSRRKK